MSMGKNPERTCKNPMCCCTGVCFENIKTLEYTPLDVELALPETEITTPDISRSLKLCRKLKGLSLRDVEEKTGISNAYLSQLETGKIKEPSFSVVVRLCKFYNIAIEDLLQN